MRNNNFNKTLLESLQTFDTDKECIEYLEQLRWENKPTCPYCKGENTDKLNKGFRCKGCSRIFTVITLTMLESPKIPINKWLRTLELHRSGVESNKISVTLNITHKSVNAIIDSARDASRSPKEWLDDYLVLVKKATKSELFDTKDVLSYRVALVLIAICMYDILRNKELSELSGLKLHRITKIKSLMIKNGHLKSHRGCRNPKLKLGRYSEDKTGWTAFLLDIMSITGEIRREENEKGEYLFSNKISHE